MSQTTNILDELIRLRKQRPFKPFTIVTADGEKHPVIEFARVATNGKAVIVIGKRDRITHFNLEDITSIREGDAKRR